MPKLQIAVFLRYFFVCFLMGTALFAAPADARTVRLGVYNFMPLIGTGDTGGGEGLYVDVFKHVADQEGWTVEVVPGSWNENLIRLAAGDIDILASIAHSPERVEKFAFTDTFLFMDWGIVYQRPEGKIATVLDLDGKRVAALKGSIYTKGFRTLVDQFGIHVEIVEKDEYAAVFEAVVSGEVDAGINAKLYGALLESDYAVERTQIFFSPVKIRYAARLGGAVDVLESLDHRLTAMKADPASYYHERVRHWLSAHVDEVAVLPAWLPGALVLLAALIGGLLLFSWLLRKKVDERTADLTREISERERVEEALRESDQRLRAIFDNTPVCLNLKDTQGRYVLVNKPYEDWLGRPAKEILGRTSAEIIGDATRVATLSDAENEVCRTGKSVENEFSILRNGKIFHRTVIKYPVFSADGSVDAIGTTAVDITDRINADEKVRAAIRIANLGYWVWEAEPNVLDCSEEFSRLVGMEEQTIENATENFIKLTHPDDQKMVAQAIEKTITKLAPYDIEFRVVRPTDGETVWIHTVGEQVLGEDGGLIGISGTAQDITVRKNTELALRKQALVWEQMSEGVIVLDSEARILDMNPAAERMFGYSADDVRGKLGSIFHREETAGRLLGEVFNGVDRDGYWSGEIDIVCKDGSVGVVEANVMPLHDENGNSIGRIAVNRDITDRKQREKNLRKLSRAVEQSANIIVITDSQGKIEYVNPKFTEVSGYSPEEVLGRNPRIVSSGKTRQEEYANLWQTITSGNIWKGEFQNKSKNGELFDVAVTISPVFGGDSTIANFIAIEEDITEHNILQQQLRMSQKLEAVGKLAGGIAHEINTPTQFIGDNLRFLEGACNNINEVIDKYQKLGEAARATEVLEAEVATAENLAKTVDIEYLKDEVQLAVSQSIEGIERVARIVLSMKDFSHPSTKDKTASNINKALETTTIVSRNEWKYVAEVDTDYDPDLPMVICLPGELNQVFLNIIINAAHAIQAVSDKGTGGKGRITATTRQDGDWVEIRIKDTGSGIPDKIKERIFDPFFTTKDVGKGTGQGLAIAFDIVVNKHGGTISVDSEEGKGSTFIIRLPIAGDPKKETA